MPEYRLVVTRIDPNPAYDAEEARRRGNWSGANSYLVGPTIQTEVLTVTLTPEEYQAVKRAVLAATDPETIHGEPLKIEIHPLAGRFGEPPDA